MSILKQIGVLTTVPMLLVLGPVLGFALGGWIDRKFHIYPWFTIIFVALGFVASVREIMRILKEITDEDNREKGQK